MKRRICFVGLILVVLLAACGPQEPTIKESAAVMNLIGDDLEGAFALQEEVPLQDLLSQLNVNESSQVVDANRRTFVSETLSMSTQVVATVIVFDSAGSAQGGLDEIKQGFSDARKKELDQLPEELRAQLGDQTYFARSEQPEEAAYVYLLLFRKSNVVCVLTVLGAAELIDEALPRDAGEKMLARIPLPTENQ